MADALALLVALVAGAAVAFGTLAVAAAALDAFLADVLARLGW